MTMVLGMCEGMRMRLHTSYSEALMTLFRWSTFLLGSQTVILKVQLFWISFSSDASICSTTTFPPLGNSDHVLSVSIDIPSNSQQDTPLIA